VFLVVTYASTNFSDADVRLTRRIHRDTVEKDRDIKAVLDQVT
jgi:uridine kinase